MTLVVAAHVQQQPVVVVHTCGDKPQRPKAGPFSVPFCPESFSLASVVGELFQLCNSADAQKLRGS